MHRNNRLPPIDRMKSPIDRMKSPIDRMTEYPNTHCVRAKVAG